MRRPYDEDRLKNNLKSTLSSCRWKIVCDYNGSARLNAIDRHYLNALNIDLMGIHTKIGQFAHRIVPEGSSLNDLKAFMEKKLTQDIQSKKNLPI